MKPQVWPKSTGPDISLRPSNVKFQEENIVYTNPIDKHLYDEPREGEDSRNNNQQRGEEDNGHYEPMENEETVVQN